MNGWVMILKNKPWIWVVITIVLCFSIYLTLYNVGYRRKALAAGNQRVNMDELLQKTECSWVQTDINSWAKIDIGAMDMKDLKDMAIKAGEFFNLEDDLELSSNHNSHTRQINLRGNDRKGLKYDIIITNSRETHIIINILDNQIFIDTNGIIDKIEDYFHGINVSPNIFATLTGAIQGELDAKQRKSMVKDLIEVIGGKATQTMEDEQLISVAGYSPMIDTAPMDNINFQIASRYNGYRDKTYLWIGTPIITIEY